MATGTPPPPDPITTTTEPDDDAIALACEEHMKEVLADGFKLDALGTAYECGYMDGLKACCRAVYRKGYQAGYIEGFKAGQLAPGP